MASSVIQDSASLVFLSHLSVSYSVLRLCLSSPVSAPLSPGYGAPLRGCHFCQRACQFWQASLAWGRTQAAKP